MSAAWLAGYSLLTGVLLVLACRAASSALERLRLPTRFVWIAGLTALAGFTLWPRPEQRVALMPLPAAAEGIHEVSVSGAATVLPQLARIAFAAKQLDGRVTDALRQLPNVPLRAMSGVWMAASVLLALLIVMTHAAMTWRGRRWPRAELHGTHVRLTHDVGPAVVGLTRPEIVVPLWMLGRSDDEQRLAIAHERAHVTAKDHILLAFGWVAVAVLPWNPITWWMLSRLRLAIELDCDARLLRNGIALRSYGELLIDLAGQLSGQRALALALADHTSHLERRLIAMKQPAKRFGKTRASVLALSAGAALLLACETKMPTSAEIEQSNVAQLEHKAVEARMLLDTGARTYTVDGKTVTQEEAKGIAAGNIARVNFKTAYDGSVVSIVTRGQSLELKPSMIEDTAAIRLRERGATAGTAARAKVATKDTFEGIVFIDGRRASMEQLARIDRSSIESVEVIKGDAAKAKYSEPAAAYGVIEVTLKK